MPRIAKDLAPFLLVASEDTLSLVLETLGVVVDVDDSGWISVDLANSLVLAVLQVWAKNNKGEIQIHFTGTCGPDMEKTRSRCPCCLRSSNLWPPRLLP